MAWKNRVSVEIGLLFMGAERGLGEHGRSQVVQGQAISARTNIGGCVSSAERKNYGCSTCSEGHVCTGEECRLHKN